MKTLLSAYLALALGTLVSEDLACIGAGIAAGAGSLSLPGAVLACAIGIVAGDFGLYLLGRIFGAGVVRLPILSRIITPAKLEVASAAFAKKGGVIILGSRFTPGMRLPTYLAAGLLRYPPLPFLAYLVVGAALWVPLLVVASSIIGETSAAWFERHSRYLILIFPALIITIWIVLGIVRKLVSWEGRKWLTSKWHRASEWEFWPPWIFYIPLIPCIIRLALKHGSPTVFCLSNPNILSGGFALESKSQILGLLTDGADIEQVARYRMIPAGAGREETLKSAMDELKTGFPIVLKPDVGERGTGVYFARDQRGANEALALHPGDLIAQEVVEGEEYGVFYARHPDEKAGRIFSITHKQLVSVKGDGASSLKHLILSAPRALRMSGFFFARWEERLAEVLPKGESLQLGDIGTHSRGSLFTDARHLITPELEQAIDRLSKQAEGFYFGRYDLRVPSAEALTRGEGIKVMELNGVGAEATHIYQPGYPLWQAYVDLNDQWSKAFAIGAANWKGLQHPPAIREFLSLLMEHRRRSWPEAPPPPPIS